MSDNGPPRGEGKMGFAVRWLLFALIALPLAAFGQSSDDVWDNAFRFAMDSSDVASGKSVFMVARPDILVQVSKHRFGADTFEITAVTPNYPPELLRSQIDKMCSRIGVPGRGIAVGTAHIGGDNRLNSTRATFATDGVINREKGILRISPIIEAFAGAPAPYTVHGLTILFNGEEPTPNVLRSYRTPGVRLQAVAMENPKVVEYRVQLLSQDPKLLEVPDTSGPPEQKPLQTTSSEQPKGVDWLRWVALILGAAAAGVLVYFLLIRATAKPRR